MGVKPLAIQWAAPAEDALDRILGFIEAENPAAARKLWARVMRAVANAALHPEMAPHFPGLGRTYREILAVRPFRVVYRVEAGALRVIAVLRQEQDFDPQRFLAD
ncbi:MAG: type II toxin-antitoxin system RelE/ParE family toxin [Holophaga sp.]|nr:type II toxin-antitoxin system RelE/ParE family toxin [Holophaga sp.]